MYKHHKFSQDLRRSQNKETHERYDKRRADLQRTDDAVRTHRRMFTHFAAVFAACFLLPGLFAAGCTRYEPAALESGVKETDSAELELFAEQPLETKAETAEEIRTPVAAKGIYLAASPVANEEFLNETIEALDQTELNAVVIDVKDDFGRITYDMQNVPLAKELGAVSKTAGDLPAVIKKLREHGVYCIARIVALKDPYLAEKKPEWALHTADGSLFRDKSGDAWVDPYQEAYWEYLVSVAKEAGRIGFDEIQFDYIRFCTERETEAVVYDPLLTKGRDKISIITELVTYLSESLRREGLFVSCDVFGSIIGSSLDAQSVGQDYDQMASALDYICPMIYPSHYSSGNFGLEHPDLAPYDCILGALKQSKTVLSSYEGYKQAAVRPWLQAFTASYLGEGNYMEYGADAIRQQIEAVYDAGYDEWILWSASAKYDYSALLTEADGEAEASKRKETRRAEEAQRAQTEETLPQELEAELSDGELSESDAEILEQDGPIVISE